MDTKLYVKSMGKIFPVRHIAQSDDEANEYMEKHDNCGVMACEKNLVIICDFYPSKVDSKVLPD